ncbi:hypothetical protein [Thalassoroseus pseudoceratinae]|uniref:hypothetical protein n=1 Tax=Thalassoroseus pseudoceratinae TaxID=2713176 RepID=UPI001423DD24|nr:hypothetical protein [Thalassoroseus pseudoceratinae]
MIRLASILLSGVALIVGCGGEAVEQTDGPPPPLTIEAWKELPIQEKYDGATFERLKDADPKLKSERAWHKFMREVVIPERNIDIPQTPGS